MDDRAWWLDGDAARDFDLRVNQAEPIEWVNGPVDVVELDIGGRAYLVPRAVLMRALIPPELVEAVREADESDKDAGWWGLRDPKNHNEFVCDGRRAPYDQPNRWPSRDAAEAAKKNGYAKHYEPFLIERRSTNAASTRARLALADAVLAQLAKSP